MDDRIVADQWGCDVPLRGSEYQDVHADYQHPLFGEMPGLPLPACPWALHRGTPNATDTPRALVTVRYVRRWYADDSREVNSIPRKVWESLTPEQQNMLRFPIGS
jgi:hypothetical protein